MKPPLSSQVLQPRARRFQARRLVSSRKFGPLFADAFACAIGLGATFVVHLVGDIFITELLLVLMFPLLLALKGRRIAGRYFRYVLVMLGLWLFGQTVTDFYVGTRGADFVRGTAAIVVFGIQIVSFVILFGENEKRRALFMVSYAIGSLLSAKFHPEMNIEGVEWKFGYALGTIYLVVLASSFLYARRRFIIAGLLLAGIIFVNLLLNFRGPVLLLLVTLALVFPVIPERIGRLRILPRGPSAVRVSVLAGMALGAAILASKLVLFATTAGLLSEEAQEKNLRQASSSSGLLLGGRPEIQVSALAVMESPILGHGSWARDLKYVEILQDKLAESGQEANLEDALATSQGLIPSHSHLMQSWVWSGILGAAFWIYMLYLTARAIVQIVSSPPRLAPVYTWLLVSLCWSILFSPFGSTARTADALCVAIALDALRDENPLRRNSGRQLWPRRRPVVRLRRSVIAGHKS